MKFLKLKSAVQQGFQASVALIEGDDAFLRKKAEELLTEPYRNDFFDLNSSFFYESYRIKDVTEQCLMLPFMSDRRVVVVRECYPTAEELDKGALGKYLRDPCTTTLLIISNQKKSEISKKAKKYVEVIDCGREENDVVVKWVISMIRSSGCQIEYPAAVKLCEFCKNDMARINTEIDKLICYCVNHMITDADVELMVAKDIEYQVYELTNALGAGNAAKAIEISNSLLSRNDSGTVPVILSTLNNYFKRLFVVQRSREADSVLADYLGVKEYAVKVAKRQAAQFREDTLKDFLNLCEDMDYRFKSGRVNAVQATRTLLLNFIRV